MILALVLSVVFLVVHSVLLNLIALAIIGSKSCCVDDDDVTKAFDTAQWITIVVMLVILLVAVVLGVLLL